MPNHVTNRLTVTGDPSEVKKFFESISGGMSDENEPIYMDFNKIIPMPESLNIESGSRGNTGIALYMAKEHGDFNGVNKILDYPWAKRDGITTFEQLYEHFTKDDPEVLNLGRQYYENYMNYGATTWYEWANKNWGTKWNAYDQQKVDDNTIEFLTAWSSVPALIEALSERFPALTISSSYADEDRGNNVGEYVYEDGKCAEVNLPVPCSEEAYSLANDLLGYCEDEENTEDDELEP